MCWTFFRTHLLEPDSVYILAGEEVVRAKAEAAPMAYRVFFPHCMGKAFPVYRF